MVQGTGFVGWKVSKVEWIPQYHATNTISYFAISELSGRTRNRERRSWNRNLGFIGTLLWRNCLQSGDSPPRSRSDFSNAARVSRPLIPPHWCKNRLQNYLKNFTLVCVGSEGLETISIYCLLSRQLCRTGLSRLKSLLIVARGKKALQNPTTHRQRGGILTWQNFKWDATKIQSDAIIATAVKVLHIYCDTCGVSVTRPGWIPLIKRAQQEGSVDWDLFSLPYIQSVIFPLPSSQGRGNGR